MQEKVTIAIPIYNAGSYLADAIQSVVNQTFVHWKLLLLCDGCTDNSYSIAKKFADADNRIEVIDEDVNKGLIYRLNQSVRMTTTKYYARMDADDVMSITRLEEEFNFLEANPEVDVVGSSIMSIDNNNNIIGSAYSCGIVSSFIHPTVMGKSEWFKANPYADWALRAEDYELWLRVARISQFQAIGKPLLFYREFGVPTFRKYFLSQLTLLKIFRNYRTYQKPYMWCLANSIMTIIKIVIYFIFNIFGKVDYLVSKRRRSQVPIDMWLSNSDLEKAIKKEL